MSPVFLIGGGWEPEGWPHTYGSFIQCASSNGHCKIVLILAAQEKDNQNEIASSYVQAFEVCGVPLKDIVVMWGTATEPIEFEALVAQEPTGVFVGGGSHAALSDFVVHQ